MTRMDALNAGMTAKEAAEEFGVTQGAMRAWASKHGRVFKKVEPKVELMSDEEVYKRHMRVIAAWGEIRAMDGTN